ncbi:MAG: Pilus assembly protein PilO [Acidobacteriota bacterium]|nr:Pilus assembly protein PilO [Acidobacteriota bacterium]
MKREVHTTDTGATHAGDQVRAGDARREQFAGRLAKLRRSRRTSFLGVPEVIALACAVALLALAFAAYFLLLVPENLNRASLERERQQLQTQIRSAGENRDQKRGVDETVDKIRQSLAHFETESLVPRDQSERGLIEELNEKIKRSGLARAQFSFIYQDDSQAGASQQSQQRVASNLSGSARRRQNVFPATDISLSIEGNYANLRRFIRDVESSPRFVVINGVQLEGLNETGAGNAARGASVSLRLDMSAYFRRNANASASSSDQNGATAARQSTSQ